MRNIFVDLSSHESASQPRRNNPTAKTTAVFGLALVLAGSGIPALAQSSATQFVPFSTFMENTRAISASAFLTSPDNKVKDPSAFAEMRQSILDRYQGVEVKHSFLLDGNHYDCVQTNQQPAMRTYGLKNVAAAPPQSLLAGNTVKANGQVQPAQAFDPERPFDEAGNSLHCEANTVPLLRVDLQTMSHFATLKDFYHKTTGKSGVLADAAFLNPSVATHKYSYTIQNVNNLGGNSNLNVWSPYVNTSAGEIFSLSQEWYVGGSGAGLQTEEVGWVVYPAMFGGSEKAHFFIFSTADDYASGCWNNSCGDFVQVADSGLLGNTFSNYSTLNGAQYEFSAEYYLYQGNWWLSYQGTWVGYYPGSKYHGGQNTKYAQSIQFGTEGVGTTLWPPEGSGQWSYTGFGDAAYQRNLWYIATSGTSYWDSLTAMNPSPLDYSISGPYTSTGAWTKYFYEGGPGGTH